MIKSDSDRNILIQKDNEKIIMVADELEYPGFEAKAELELLIKAEALLKSVCKIAITENAANQECVRDTGFTKRGRGNRKSYGIRPGTYIPFE